MPVYLRKRTTRIICADAIVIQNLKHRRNSRWLHGGRVGRVSCEVSGWDQNGHLPQIVKFLCPIFPVNVHRCFLYGNKELYRNPHAAAVVTTWPGPVATSAALCDHHRMYVAAFQRQNARHDGANHHAPLRVQNSIRCTADECLVCKT